MPAALRKEHQGKGMKIVFLRNVSRLTPFIRIPAERHLGREGTASRAPDEPTVRVSLDVIAKSQLAIKPLRSPSGSVRDLQRGGYRLADDNVFIAADLVNVVVIQNETSVMNDIDLRDFGRDDNVPQE